MRFHTSCMAIAYKFPYKKSLYNMIPAVRGFFVPCVMIDGPPGSPGSGPCKCYCVNFTTFSFESRCINSSCAQALLHWTLDRLMHQTLTKFSVLVSPKRSSSQLEVTSRICCSEPCTVDIVLIFMIGELKGWITNKLSKPTYQDCDQLFGFDIQNKRACLTPQFRRIHSELEAIDFQRL